jgi:putative acetyltransferase
MIGNATLGCDQSAVRELFYETFAHSEGADEGRIISDLASELARQMSQSHTLFYGLSDTNDALIAGAFTSSLTNDREINAKIMAPVAVHPDAQGHGLSRQLIEQIIDTESKYSDLLVTYGDPNFYRRFGFRTISTAVVKPPYEIEYPEGWLAVHYTNKSESELAGQYNCVEAFRDERLW